MIRPRPTVELAGVTDLVILVVLATLVILATLGCSSAAKIEIVAGFDVCHECQMVIDLPRQAAGYLANDKFVTFDSPICLLRSYDALDKRGEALPLAIHFAVDESGTLQSHGTAMFLLTDHHPTLMDGRVLAFADRASADAVRTEDDEVITDWSGFRLARGKPDRVVEVQFGPEGMSPDVVNAARGELIQWRARSTGYEEGLVLEVKGYPELETVVVPASGNEVVFRMRAVRPGAGFPIVADGSDRALGMLKVTGPHTVDEGAEEMR